MPGVAFVRACGAVLFGLGAVLWAASARAGPRNIEKAVFISSAFAAVILLTQQVAIWANAVGFVLVGLFCVVTLISGIGLLRNTGSTIPHAG
jgi:hypothetical protein